MIRFIKSSLVVFLGFVFVFSAIAKMVPLEFFEFQIAEIVHIPWRYVQLLARLIIGVEFALGVLIIAHVELRRLSIPLVLGMLSVFTGLLLYQYALHGNEANCGCFGDQVEMSTLAGIGKNIVLIIVALVIRYMAPDWEWKLGKYRWVYPIVFIGIMIIAWQMMKPITWARVTDRKPLNQVVNYDILYDSTQVDKVPSIDYRQGKHIVIFADYNCGHCKLAAKKCAIMKSQEPDLPFLFVLTGDSLLVDSFKHITHSSNVEQIRLNNSIAFTILAGNDGFPSINWLKNDTLQYHTVHFDLVLEDIQEWLKN